MEEEEALDDEVEESSLPEEELQPEVALMTDPVGETELPD